MDRSQVRHYTHASAVILLGWSLIGPPPLQHSRWSAYWPWSARNGWNVAAPLSQWVTRDTFATRESCQTALAVMHHQNAAYLASSIESWRCVSADDPALAN